MNLLLDSHAFIWWHEDPVKLSQTAFSLLSKPQNQFYISIASIWELQIKILLRKFGLVDSLKNAVEVERTVNGMKILQVELNTYSP